jgi:endoglucanase
MVSHHSVAGDEQAFAQWLKDQLAPHAGQINIDRLGNLIAHKGENPQVALFAHMDTVGYMVKNVDGTMVELSPIGRPHHAHGARVLVLTENGEIEGVVIEKGEKDDKKSYVDTGLANPGEVIQIGDFVTYVPRYTRQGDIVITRSLDDKLGCYIGAEVFKRADEMIFVGTVREEQGLGGVRSAAYTARPAAALVVDVTYDENIIDAYHIKIGQGPAICLKDSLLADRQMVETLKQVAAEKDIPLQFEVLDSGGSDAKKLFDVREGIPFVFIGIPIRYSHTAFEMANLKDVENAIELIVAFLAAYDRA